MKSRVPVAVGVLLAFAIVFWASGSIRVEQAHVASGTHDSGVPTAPESSALEPTPSTESASPVASPARSSPGAAAQGDAAGALAPYLAPSAEQALVRALRLPAGDFDRTAVLSALRQVCSTSNAEAHFKSLVQTAQLPDTAQARHGFERWTVVRARFCGSVEREGVDALLTSDARVGPGDESAIFLQSLGEVAGGTEAWRTADDPEVARALWDIALTKDSPAMAETALAWPALAPDAFPEAAALPDLHFYSGATLQHGRAGAVRAGVQIYLCRAFRHCGAGALRSLSLGPTPDGRLVDVEARIREQVSPLQWQVAEELAVGLLSRRDELAARP